MRYLKNIIFLIGIITIHHTKSQEKLITIVDKHTKSPISGAHVYYPNLNKGSVSNVDGVVKVSIEKNDSLHISNVGYETKKTHINKLADIDTISLTPRIYNIDDIIVYGYDLKQKIEEVLDNYESFYYNSKGLYNCTYKESAKVNGTFSRLNQVQLQWWRKNGFLGNYEDFEKKNKLSLISIDYSKNETKFPNGFFLSNKYILSKSYLNWFLNMLLYHTEEKIEITRIDKEKNTTKITFTTPIYTEKSLEYTLKDSYIIIENKTGVITAIYWNCFYNGRKKNDVNKENNEPFTSEVKRNELFLSMKQLSNQKWSIGYFYSTGHGEIIYKGKNYNILLTQEFYVTSEQKKGKINETNTLNLDTAFYKNFPAKEKNVEVIRLGKEEQKYINN